MTTLELLEARAWRRMAPPPRLTIAQWADEHRVLFAESSAEPGQWSTNRTPYLREPMEAITDRKTKTVVIMASSQVGKTEVLLNTFGYTIHLDPRPTMLIEPTLDIASAVSKDRLAPMLRDTPALQGLVAPMRGRDGSNTTLHKAFPGGHLTLAGANSPASLASRPIALLLADEVDRWERSVGRKGISGGAASEGDPLALAMKRTTTFQRRKIVITSSPTIKGGSRIEDWFEISDQRRYFIPCPRCAEPFVLEWEHIRWDDGDITTAHIECPGCAGRIEDAERPAMMRAGQWRAAAPFAGIAGFHIWEALAPWTPLRELVQGFLAARHSLEMRQAWRNTVQGLTWEAPGQRLEASHLLARRESYAADLPEGVLLLTAGIDTQDDRLELVVIGWGTGEEAWIVARESLPGDPARPDVWLELDELLARPYAHARGGTLTIQCACIDSAGHRTQAVYTQVIPRQPRRLYATIGRAGGTNGLLVSPPKPVKPANGTGTVLRRIVDTDQGKGLIYSRLRLLDPGPEFIHFPMTVGETFFDELTAEQLMTRRNKFGVPAKHWEQIRERNEALDCSVLALAALRIIAPDARRLAAWGARLLGAMGAPPVPVAVPTTPEPEPARPVRTPWLGPRRGWLGR